MCKIRAADAARANFFPSFFSAYGALPCVRFRSANVKLIKHIKTYCTHI